MTVTIVVVCVRSHVCVCMCRLLTLFPQHQGSVIGACGCVRYKLSGIQTPRDKSVYSLCLVGFFVLFFVCLFFSPRPAVGNPIQSKGR